MSEQRYQVYHAQRSEAVDSGWRWAIHDTQKPTGYPIIAWCCRQRVAQEIAAGLNRGDRRAAVIAAGMGRNPLRAGAETEGTTT